MRIIEWLGSIMLLAAFIEFAASPRKALESISEVLTTNPRIENGHMVLRKIK